MARVFLGLGFSLLSGGAALQGAVEPKVESNASAEELDVALPDVDSMLSEATSTVNKLTKTADKMERAMTDNQVRRQEQLDVERKSYEARLIEQDKATVRITAENGVLTRAIESLGLANSDIRKAAKNLQDTNKGVRELLYAFKPKFTAANTFLSAAMNLSEAPLHAKELRVLQEPIPAPTLENFLNVLRDDDDKRQHSLMQTGAVRKAGAVHQTMAATMNEEIARHARVLAEETAENIVHDLSKQITMIGQAQEQGDNKLKAEFLANFEARQVKNDQLLLEQAELNTTKVKTLQEQHELHHAKKALLAMSVNLVARVEGISTFAQKTSKYIADRIVEARGAKNGTSTSTLTSAKRLH